MFKIITRALYNDLLSTIATQHKLIAEQKTAIEYYQKYSSKLEHTNQKLINMLYPDNIDFPNSTKGGYEDSNIFNL